MGVSPGRGRSAPTLVRSSNPRHEPTLARDLRITAAHAIGEGSLKQKTLANLAAIRALKTRETENRAAAAEEKSVLVKYTGWGAMPNAFASQPPREWQSVQDELRALLTDDEWASARASTPNAHYTSPEVIQAIWQAMERFGLQPGAKILEPSMGVGHFWHRISKRAAAEVQRLPALGPRGRRVSVSRHSHCQTELRLLVQDEHPAMRMDPEIEHWEARDSVVIVAGRPSANPYIRTRMVCC